MEDTTFKGASLELQAISESGDFDFDVDINQVKECFYDTFYITLREGDDNLSPDEITAQAQAMIQAIDFDFDEDTPDHIKNESDNFSPGSGHFTETMGEHYAHIAGITIKVKPDTPVTIEDVFIDLAVEQYISDNNLTGSDSTVTPTYYNNNAVAAAKLESDNKAEVLKNQVQPSPDDHTKPKLTPPR